MESVLLAEETGFKFGTTPFYFLRHGETHESRVGIVQGHDETELNPTGRRMAEVAAEALLTVPLRSIYASPLKRAWRTASIVSVLTRVPLYSREGLKERHWGDFQGRHKAHRPSSRDPESAETSDDFRQRVTTAMESIEGPSPVLVVAHSGVFRAICESVGISIEGRISVTSGQVLRMEPPAGQRKTWCISVISN